jgi:hypothetical protein
MSRPPAVEILEGRLSPRALEVVATLAELRFASARQLERWHFVGATPLARARSARRSLERLTSLGVLARLDRRIGGVRAGSAGYIYGLDLAGQRIAAEHGWLRLKRSRRLQEPSRTFLRHLLAVGELHLRVIEADRAGGALELLDRQAEPACWRAYTDPGGSRLILKPDAFVVVATADLEWSWFCELDRATESLTTIERKLSAYVAYWHSGREVAERGVQPRTLWLAPTARRVEQLTAAIERLPLEAQPLFMVAAFDQATCVLIGDTP